MRSFIFCTSFMQRKAELTYPYRGIAWIEEYRHALRWKTWLRYYSRRKELFGVERIFLVDDGTPLKNIRGNVTLVDADEALPDTLPTGIVMFRFKEHYGRRSLREFPGWWRSFAFAFKIQEKYGFDKIIHIESDAFVVSRRMAEYINNLASGWTVFFCPVYNFPETAIQIICKDSISKLKQFWDLGKDFWQQSMLAEQTLPFTEINRQFVGERYGERYKEFNYDYPDTADYVCQAHCTMVFKDKLRPPFVKPIHWWLNKISAVCIKFIFKRMWKISRKVLRKRLL